MERSAQQLISETVDCRDFALGIAIF